MSLLYISLGDINKIYSPPTSFVSDVISAYDTSSLIGPLYILYWYEFSKYSEVTTTSVEIFERYWTINFLSLKELFEVNVTFSNEFPTVNEFISSCVVEELNKSVYKFS